MTVLIQESLNGIICRIMMPIDAALLTYEEPCGYEDNDFQRFYPVKDIKGVNKSLYQNIKNYLLNAL